MDRSNCPLGGDVCTGETFSTVSSSYKQNYFSIRQRVASVNIEFREQSDTAKCLAKWNYHVEAMIEIFENEEKRSGYSPHFSNFDYFKDPSKDIFKFGSV